MRPWTRNEEREAVRLRGLGHKCLAIARVLGRTKEAVEKRLVRLGVPTMRRRGELAAEVTRLWKAGCYDQDMAEILDVDPSVIYATRKRLGLVAPRVRHGRYTAKGAV